MANTGVFQEVNPQDFVDAQEIPDEKESPFRLVDQEPGVPRWVHWETSSPDRLIKSHYKRMGQHGPVQERIDTAIIDSLIRQNEILDGIEQRKKQAPPFKEMQRVWGLVHGGVRSIPAWQTQELWDDAQTDAHKDFFYGF